MGLDTWWIGYLAKFVIGKKKWAKADEFNTAVHLFFRHWHDKKRKEVQDAEVEYHRRLPAGTLFSTIADATSLALKNSKLVPIVDEARFAEELNTILHRLAEEERKKVILQKKEEEERKRLALEKEAAGQKEQEQSQGKRVVK